MLRKGRLLTALLTMALLGSVLVAAQPVSAESATACPGAQVPGWIHSSSLITYGVCGPVGQQNWVWVLTRIDNAFRDDVYPMCIDTGIAVPTGWVEIVRQRVYFNCGIWAPPGTVPGENLRLIRCLTCPARPPNASPPEGAIDGVANTGQVNGWARDPGAAGTSIQVDYYVDGPAGTGVAAGSAVADQRRPDIAPGDHGMRFVLPERWFDGRLHTIYAYGRDLTGDQPALLGGGPKLFILPSRPIGFLEAVDPLGNAKGWAIDPSLQGYGQATSVDFFVDDFHVANVPADLPRADVAATYGYPGDHGFHWSVPNDFRDGAPHRLRAVARDLTGDQARELPGSPVTFSIVRRAAHVDFDGDHRTDIAIFRGSDGGWWHVQSSTGNHVGATFGQAGDIPVAADYNGDGRLDLAVFRRTGSAGVWHLLLSPDWTYEAVSFGYSDDKPVPADYTGDGKADIAVYRPSDGTWYIRASGGDGSFYGVAFGISTDKPVPGDYDGDGKTDIAVYRAVFGAWIIHRSSDNQDSYYQFGISTDRPVPADYDGDGRTDRAVFRSGDSTWHILGSVSGTYRSLQWGLSQDIACVGDYDGDNLADIAVYRPGNSTFYLNQSRDGQLFLPFGITGDIPITRTSPA